MKTLALDRIRSELGKCDIVKESFSKFTSKWVEPNVQVKCSLIEPYRFDEIRDLYVQQLAYTWVEDSTEATRTSIEKNIDSFVQGDLEHAAEMVAALWKIVNKDEDVKPPSNTTPTVSPPQIRFFSRAMWRYLLLMIRPLRSRAPHTGSPWKLRLSIRFGKGCSSTGNIWLCTPGLAMR